MEKDFQNKVDKNKNNLRILLKNIRKSKNISQSHLAKMTNLTQQQISRLENLNGSEPNLNILMKYMTALNIDIVSILKNYYSN